MPCYDFCSPEEFTRRLYARLIEDLAGREGMTVEEVRRIVPFDALKDGGR